MPLSEDEKDFVSSLQRITASIDEIYTKLYNLELEGMRNSDAYRSTLAKLNGFLILEKEIYASKKITVDFAYKIITSLNNPDLPFNLSTHLKDLPNTKYNFERICSRIEKHLSPAFFNDQETAENTCPKFIVDIYKKTDKNNYKELLAKTVKVGYDLKMSLETDIIGLFLILLERYINDPSYRMYKKELLSTKYNLIFMYTSVEEDYFNRKFNTPKELYTRSKLTADLGRIESQDYYNLRNSICHAYAISETINLLQIDNLSYGVNSKAVEAILYKCLLDTVVALDSNNCYIEKNIKAFTTRANEEESISVCLVEEAISAKKDYVTLVRELSLKSK